MVVLSNGADRPGGSQCCSPHRPGRAKITAAFCPPLRAAVAAAARRRFTRAAEGAIAEAPGTAGDARVAAGIGDLRSARDTPGLVHIMSGARPLAEDCDDLVAAARGRCEVRARVCAPVAHGARRPAGGPKPRSGRAPTASRRGWLAAGRNCRTGPKRSGSSARYSPRYSLPFRSPGAE